VEQLASFVTGNGFSGVDIDFEDDAGFTGSYDGIGFLISLTNGLAQEPDHLGEQPVLQQPAVGRDT